MADQPPITRGRNTPSYQAADVRSLLSQKSDGHPQNRPVHERMTKRGRSGREQVVAGGLVLE